MRRTYGRERYLALAERLRDAIPDLALTTDIIVGFPGETEDDFRETLEVVEEVRYDGAYTFVYSPRRGTEAAAMTDQVPEDVKRERIERLIDVVQRIAARAERGARRRGGGGPRRGPQPHRSRAPARTHAPQHDRELPRRRQTRASSSEVRIESATSTTLAGTAQAAVARRHTFVTISRTTRALFPTTLEAEGGPRPAPPP